MALPPEIVKACTPISGCEVSRRMFKKAFQQGRSEQRCEAYIVSYVEHPSDARTMLKVFFNIL